MPLPLHLERFPGAAVVHRIPTDRDCLEFLDGLDVVLTCETSYNHNLYALAEARGVKTVLQYNYEFMEHLRNKMLRPPTLFASPSTWHFDDVPFANKMLLPVPIETDRFPERAPSAKATRFLHIVGRPATEHRNGTPDLLEALQHVRSEITVSIKCQDPNYVPGLLKRGTMPSNVELVIQSGDVLNYWDNYADADVLVMPRRFGGLCLPINEALGAGMPTIAPDISPNNDWLPSDWLVPASKYGELMTRALLGLYKVEPRQLAAKIDQFASDREFYAASADSAGRMAKELSWDEQRPVYQKLFADLCGKGA